MAREAARDDTRLIVIFLDDYHTRRGNGLRVREQLGAVGEHADRTTWSPWCIR